MSTEYYINPEDSYKKAMYLVKESLKDKQELVVNAGVSTSLTATKVCNSLEGFKYVTITNITTSTKIVNDKRKIIVAFTLKKTSDFDKLYQENEEKRKQLIEERENSKTNTDVKN